MPKSIPSAFSQSQPLFCTTIKSGEYYKGKEVEPCESRTQNKCSVKWDYNCGQRVPYHAVDYGQELYEQAAQNLARELHRQKLIEGKPSLSEIEDNCQDLSKPAINTSKYSSRALEKAIEDLQRLPEGVESSIRKDKRFEAIILSKATRSLNVPRSQKIYKDLIPVDPNRDVQTETENNIQAELKKSIEAARQPSRNKDPEPSLEDFQKNSQVRVRPASVEQPQRPSTGISTSSNDDFETILSERRSENESSRF